MSAYADTTIIRNIKIEESSGNMEKFMLPELSFVLIIGRYVAIDFHSWGCLRKQTCLFGMFVLN